MRKHEFRVTSNLIPVLFSTLSSLCSIFFFLHILPYFLPSIFFPFLFSIISVHPSFCPIYFPSLKCSLSFQLFLSIVGSVHCWFCPLLVLSIIVSVHCWFCPIFFQLLICQLVPYANMSPLF